MSRIRTVGDLISELQELPEDMPIMAAMQPSWPLREYIGGVWVDDPSDPSTQEEEDNICPNCGYVSLGVPTKNSSGQWYRKCECGEEVPCEEPEPAIVYIVLNGQPRDKSPYISKNAWSVI